MRPLSPVLSRALPAERIHRRFLAIPFFFPHNDKQEGGSAPVQAETAWSEEAAGMKTMAGRWVCLMSAVVLGLTVGARARTWSEESGALSFTSVGEVKVTDPTDESNSGHVGMTHLSLWAPFGQADIGNLQFAAGGALGWTRFTFDGFPTVGNEDG